MPKVDSIDGMQEILKGWLRKPGESDEEWRARINSGDYEISIPLFSVPKLMEEQEDRLRFDGAKRVIEEIRDGGYEGPIKMIEGTSEPEKTFFEQVDEIDRTLDEANKKEEK